MSLTNPMALLGMTTLVVPVIIHFLGRRQARPQKFPSLRFLTATRLMPARRTRLNDILVLAVRLAIIAAATIALAQPHFGIGARAVTSVRDHRLVRAIIVDTSASMHRPTPSGDTVIAAARRQARQLSSEATTSAVIETATPALELKGATQWLGTQPGQRELVVVSDFQLGTIDSVDLAGVATDIGRRFARIEVREGGSTIRTKLGGRSVKIALTPDQTIADWDAQTSPVDSAGPVILVGAAERPLVGAARSAARATDAAPISDVGLRVALIYMGFEGRTDQLARAGQIDRPWMGDLVVRLHTDPTLLAAGAVDSTRDTTPVDTDRFNVVVRDGAGHPLVLASRGNVGDGEGLQLWVLADAGSLTSAALFAALPRALADGSPPSELEPKTISAGVLATWERPAAAPTDIGSGPSDGRWLWLVVLALLAIETYVRRADRGAALPFGPPAAEVRDVA
jgi:hypothetical protein